MSIVRSLYKPGDVVDFTEQLLVVPNTYGKLTQMGLFDVEGVATTTVQFEMIEQSIGLSGDSPRGGFRNRVGKDYERKVKSYFIPHFNYDDAISPRDLAGKVAYGGIGAGEIETLDGVRLRKMERLRKSHAQQLEIARVKTIVTGDIYAPNGTTSGNFYTDFGVTRKEVNFALSTTSTEVLLKNEEVIAHIQDNAFSGEVIERVVYLCSPQFFNAYVTQSNVKAAYSQYTSSQEPLRNRLGTGIDREFTFGGVTLMEYRAAFNGTPFIPAGDAYAIPLGTTDVFKSYFAPAERFGIVNTLGVEQYLFEKGDDTEIILQSESNFLNVVRKPQLVVKCTIS